ncbi:LLM class flavin-dependent oxidoreductase [Xanthobacter autotrophicus]|uniref:LLM class flavin-dependent oxidoreductase n=1 Tax=Xanthobacter autotrophicus TaxID=280 RepID=UPI001E5D6D57|nr:LLM class flavin-dependent oxidoreductase [Xanthobacter autotrophicus]UDQ87224.1 LLM class flavin-dependent oxidoreductase [Xanthobacter autotrophicus]
MVKISGQKPVLSPLEQAKANPLMLGLFLPIQSGAWSPSTAPRDTSWTFDYNARCTVMAEELGFDLVFGLAQWMGKGGYGGEMKFREMATDPLLVTAGLAAITRRILLVSTVHILYGWHPLHLAKFGATISEMSSGRWGLNMVTGYKRSEFEMFGLEQIEHDHRYVMADEFVTMMKRLWSEDENITLDGRFWKMKEAFIAPKPAGGKCVLVNASSSGAGLDYAVKHSDLIFVTSPAGANLDRACAALPPHTARIKQAAAAQGRDVRTLINPHVICRETEAEAWAQYDAILRHQDPVAAENFYRTFTGGDQSSWKAATREEWTIGGNVHIVGTPTQVVEGFQRLKAAGCDGVQVNFYDFLPDLKFFGERVLPIMHEAGLRLDQPLATAA